MSSDAGSVTNRTAHEECTYCEKSLSDAVLAVQTYSPDGIDQQTGLVEGGLLLCAECATEPVTLLDSWDPRPDPPVAADRPIADGYAETAGTCSFCADPIESAPVLGVECYRRPGRTLPPYANYALCPDCRDVFAEFLANLRESIV
ncbi:MAG: hypothetical protein ACOCPZ_02455 [Natrialbaceae archaeon]